MTKRKILFLIPSLVGGGAERALINLLNKIDYEKYEITLVVVIKKGVYLNQIHEKVNVIILFKSDFFVRALSFIQKKMGLSFAFKNKIRKKVNDKYDVGICFLDSNFTDLLFEIKEIEKRYTWVHSSYKSYVNYSKFYTNPNYKKYLIEKRYGNLDGIIFVSNDSLNEFIEVFKIFPEMKVIYNLVDIKMVKEKSLEITKFNNEKFNFISIGSLLPVKGYDLLIKAAKILKNKGFTFEVNIYGSGPEENKLLKLINNLDLENFVYLRGFNTNPYKYLKQADAFVMTSISEALPMVLCEAMVLGKPAIVTNCSGCRELVNSGEYGMMSNRDVNEYAECMIKLMSDKNTLEYFSKKSLDRSKIFSDESILEECYKVFNK